MSRVVVNESFKMFHGHQPLTLEAGQVIEGSLAEHLARTARKRVTVLDDDQPASSGAQQDQDPPAPADKDLDIDASVADVLAWVGDDPTRAADALDLEEAKDAPRSTLVKQLAKIADA